jgi:hypothetical protein
MFQPIEQRLAQPLKRFSRPALALGHSLESFANPRFAGSSAPGLQMVAPQPPGNPLGDPDGLPARLGVGALIQRIQIGAVSYPDGLQQALTGIGFATTKRH